MKRSSLIPAIVGALLIATVTACAPTPASTPASTSVPSATGATAEPPTEIVGTVVRFTSDRTSVDVTIGEDSPGVRDFLSLLPTNLTFEEFAGREKISYLPRELNYEGSPGSDPENGDLIYFTSWGNLGFYYNADGIDYSDATLHIGTYDATEEQLALLEGPVSVEILD